MAWRIEVVEIVDAVVEVVVDGVADGIAHLDWSDCKMEQVAQLPQEDVQPMAVIPVYAFVSGNNSILQRKR